MKRKNIIMAVILTAVILLFGCTDSGSSNPDVSSNEQDWESEKEENSSAASGTQEEDSSEGSNAKKEDSRYQIGDTVSFNTWDGGTVNLTITEWGSVWNVEEESIIYIKYTFENTGETQVRVGNSDFNVYADDYSVDLFDAVSASDSKGEVLSGRELSSGRKVDGVLYPHANPDNANVIELEYGDAVFIIKDGNAADAIEKAEGNSGVSDGEEWNLGEFSEEWYKSTPNFEDAEGNMLEIIYDDYGELQFAINGMTMYYCMADEHIDYGDGIYIYTLKDDGGNEVTMLYYPKDTVQIDSMVFTVVQ